MHLAETESSNSTSQQLILFLISSSVGALASLTRQRYLGDDGWAER